MQQIFDWVFEVAAVSILATLFEMLLPSGNIKRFCRVVLSLCVMIALLKPLVSLLRGYA